MKKTKAKKEQEPQSGQKWPDDLESSGHSTTKRRPSTGAAGEKGLPEGWVETSIGQLFKEIKDKVIPNPSKPSAYLGLEHLKSGGGIETIGTSKDLKSSKGIFGKGDVLYGKLRPYLNKHAVVDFDGVCSTDIIIFRAVNSHLAKFLDAFLGTNELLQYANQNSKGINLPRISPKLVKDALLPLPPEKEIIRIVSRLDALLARAAAARERLERVPDLLRQFRQSVLARAVSGELTREWRGHENNWEKAQLKNVCRKIQDGAHHSPKNKYADPSEGRYMYITSKNIRNNGLDLTNVEYIDEDYHQTIYPRCNPEIGDVLLTKDGVNTGNVTLNTLAKPFSLLSSVCLIKTNGQKLLPGFLMYYIQSPIGFNSITGEMTGTAIKRIVLRQIKKAEIPLPPLPEQREIVRRVEALFAIAGRIEERYEQLREQVEVLPQAVLAKAFRGELVEQDAGDEPAGELLRRIKDLQ